LNPEIDTGEKMGEQKFDFMDAGSSFPILKAWYCSSFKLRQRL